MANDDEEDCWDAFGSDSDDDAGGDEDGSGGGGDHTNNTGGAATTIVRKDAAAVALHLSLFFLKQNAQVHLKERVVGLLVANRNNNDFYDSVKLPLEQREMKVVKVDNDDLNSTASSSFLDAIVVMDDSDMNNETTPLLDRLVPGGLLIVSNNNNNSNTLTTNKAAFLEESTEIDGTCFIGLIKKPIHAHTSICPWLPSSSQSKKAEEERLRQATVVLSSHEISNSRMVDSSIQRAVDSMNQCGYCIVRNLLNPTQSKEWGDAVLESVHGAAKILLERDQVDIYNPQNSQFEPQSYRELSMREDLRLDLRHGPELAALRCSEGKNNENGNEAVIVKAPTKEFDGFLRGHTSILEILRRTMNPKRDDLYKGNIGRYNFEGTGADGSFQDLRVSPVGGIVSFPGAAEQAIHADTPHLFEHIPNLPAHYINIFTPGVPFDEKVGGTAFVHGSHNLEFTAKNYGGDDNNDTSKVYPFLVRPCLTLGDVILFDCRILHFGLANASKSIERVLLYTNTTHAWFHDPKNWDDRKPIFEE